MKQRDPLREALKDILGVAQDAQLIDRLKQVAEIARRALEQDKPE